MIGLMRTKTHRQAVERLATAKAEREASLHKALRDLTYELHEAEKIVKSTERQAVVKDLMTALGLIKDYQRALSTMSVPDPQIAKANTLMDRWGLKGERDATFLGFRTASPPVVSRVPSSVHSVPSPDHIAEEEKRWGDEAYGKANVRIVAEKIDPDENPDAEGTVRARIRFEELTDYEGEQVDSIWEDYPGTSTAPALDSDDDA